MPRTLTITLLKEDEKISVKDMNKIFNVGETKYLASQNWGAIVIDPIVRLLEEYQKNNVGLPEKIKLHIKTFSSFHIQLSLTFYIPNFF